MPARAGLSTRYDLVVIGGGVHGAALALEASRRGRRVLLAEKHDFCSGTSANSLKIIHGGLRYLQSADLLRSRESAREQSRLLALAPHLVEDLPCLMGTRRSMSRGRAAMALGMWFYDSVVRSGLPARPRGSILSVAEANRLAGAGLFDDCTGAAMWYDARVVDTERLVLTYLKTAEAAGARVLNYMAVEGVSRGNGVVVSLRDELDGSTKEVETERVIDSGSWIDPHPHWARAVNLVLDRPPSPCALGLTLEGSPEGRGRLFFATPHERNTIIGTWYFRDRGVGSPRLDTDELEQCLADTRSMLPHLDIGRGDVAAVQVGRLPVGDPDRPLSLLDKPLIGRVGGDDRVWSVTGVKYTTARPTAVQALRSAGLAGGPEPAGGPWYGAGDGGDGLLCRVRDALETRIPPEKAETVARRLCRQYGAVAVDIVETGRRVDDGLARLPGCDAVNAEIHYCIEHEQARTLGDFVLRRSGLGSLSALPEATVRYCAELMGDRLDWTGERRERELASLAAHYCRVESDHTGAVGPAGRP